MKYPKISLVTVCYNHADYIGETIESIINQNYPNLEYVVIDDGSKDNSWEVIKKYKKHLTGCERLEGYRKFPTEALNYGINRTSGPIMGWLNSDDILLPKSLFIVAKVFHDLSQVKWFTGMATTINTRSEIVNSNLRFKNVYDFLLDDWKVIQQESTFFKRDLWDKAGGEFINNWAFDTELWTRFFYLTDHYHVATPLGAFRKGQQSKSISDEDSFGIPNLEHLKKFKSKASTEIMNEAIEYKHLREWIKRVPLDRYKYRIAKQEKYRKYFYKLIEYNFPSDKWILKYKNSLI